MPAPVRCFGGERSVRMGTYVWGMRMNPRRQGDLGEFSAMHWLAQQGYALYLPLGHSPNVDLIAERGDELIRVQVKTSTVLRRDRWEVTICTRGGNQSWNGVVKLL